MSSINPEKYKLSERTAKLTARELLPVNQTAQAETREFLQKVIDILMDYVNAVNNREEKVLEFRHPEFMKSLHDFTIGEEPVPLQQLINDCCNTLKYQVKSGHPHFFNQLANGLDIVSMAGEWLAATANTNMFTYEISPVYILMENFVLAKMRSFIWPDHVGGDSILAPGGSICNLYAFLAARYKMFPEVKTRGPRGIPGELCMFTSDQSHYSIKQSASVTGVGLENCVMVPSDPTGHMIPSELERLIIERKSRGQIPFFVNATAGTTVLGAFDPLDKIADICEKYNCWMHVDSAWGGGLLLSKKYRHPRFSGLERANSITWNPHKLMGTILQCSTIHFKEDGLLLKCNQMSAKYLFMADKFYDVQYDTGDKVIQCGRHNDIFKLWLQWRSKGDNGFEAQINRLMDLAQYQVKRIKEQPDKFYLLMEPEFVNVSFWYIPKRLRNVPHSPEKEQELGKLCPLIKARMMQAGTMMCAYQADTLRPNYFRSIISSAAVTEEDVDFLLNEFDRLGNDL